MHQLDYEIRPKTRIYLAFAGRQFDIRQTIFAVPELRSDQFLKKRMLGAGSDWDVTTIGQSDHAQRVLQALTCRHISGDHGDSAHVQFRRVQRQHHGQGIIGPGIGVEDDLLCGRKCRKRNGQIEQ